MGETMPSTCIRMFMLYVLSVCTELSVRNSGSSLSLLWRHLLHDYEVGVRGSLDKDYMEPTAQRVEVQLRPN